MPFGALPRSFNDPLSPPETSSLSGPRVSRVVSFLEAIGRDVCVDLRGHQVRVPEKFLHAAQIGAGVEQMRRVAVTKLVRREMRIESGPFQVVLQPLLQSTGWERFPRFAGAQEDRMRGPSRCGELIPVAADGHQSRLADRNEALFASLAPDAH